MPQCEAFPLPITLKGVVRMNMFDKRSFLALVVVALFAGLISSIGTNQSIVGSAVAQEFGSSVSTRATCVGDGVSGKRVQVLYVRPSDQPDRFQEYRNSFRTWAVEADRIFQASASQMQGDQSGSVRYIRFVHDSDCRVDVQKVVIPPITSPSSNYFLGVQQALAAKGYDQVDRRYLIFLEFNAADTPVGQSQVFSDDRPGTENVQHIKSGWSVIYRGYWQVSSSVAHELAHSLGAVQMSAPNALGANHCKDGYDLMCYGDPDSGYDIVCEDTAMINLLDCNKDDYFNTDPDPGNYLYDHWNVADSPFLGQSLAAMVLDKTSGKYNGWVTATLSRFAPGKRIYLSFNGAALTSIVADGGGNAIVSFRTPLAPYGDAVIRARTGDKAHDVQTVFRVIPRVLLSESTAQRGQVLKVYLYGYAIGERVEVQFNTTGSAYVVLGTATIASNGRGAVLVTIPASSSYGSHTIRGKVIGVSRSATAPITIEPAADLAPTQTPTPAPTMTPSPTLAPTITGTPTLAPTQTETASPTITPEPTWTETTTSTPAESATPAATESATAEATIAVESQEEVLLDYPARVLVDAKHGDW